MLSRLNIAAIGKTGEGKSATLNTLLKACDGRPEEFVERGGAVSVTKCVNERTATLNGLTTIRFVDTVGLFDTEWTDDMGSDDQQGKSMLHAPELDAEHRKTLEELAKIVSFCTDGIHAFLLMVNGTTRFTLETKQTIRIILRYLGSEMLNYVIFVVTKADQATQEDLESTKKFIGSFLKDKGFPNTENKVIFWNNKQRPPEQVTELMNKIHANLASRGNKAYTHTAFQHAQEMLSKQKEELKQRFTRELDGKIQQETKIISEKYDARIGELDKTIKEKQKEMQEVQVRNQKEMNEINKKMEEKEKQMVDMKYATAEERAKMQMDMQEYRNQAEMQRVKAESELRNIQVQYQMKQEMFERESQRKEEEMEKTIENLRKDSAAQLEMAKANMEAQMQSRDEQKELLMQILNRPPVVIHEKSDSGCSIM